ncbi:hypothetical protein Ddc_14723 [Ditylenchus destructor]|nr:hypothetical protein Ddc_14723 [Ditylenchus destructor]
MSDLFETKAKKNYSSSSPLQSTPDQDSRSVVSSPSFQFGSKFDSNSKLDRRIAASEKSRPRNSKVQEKVRPSASGISSRKATAPASSRSSPHPEDPDPNIRPRTNADVPEDGKIDPFSRKSGKKSTKKKKNQKVDNGEESGFMGAIRKQAAKGMFSKILDMFSTESTTAANSNCSDSASTSKQGKIAPENDKGRVENHVGKNQIVDPPITLRLITSPQRPNELGNMAAEKVMRESKIVTLGKVEKKNPENDKTAPKSEKDVFRTIIRVQMAKPCVVVPYNPTGVANAQEKWALGKHFDFI